MCVGTGSGGGGGSAALRRASRDVYCSSSHGGPRVVGEGASGRAGVLSGTGEREVSGLVGAGLALARKQYVQRVRVHLHVCSARSCSADSMYKSKDEAYLHVHL